MPAVARRLLPGGRSELARGQQSRRARTHRQPRAEPPQQRRPPWPARPQRHRRLAEPQKRRVAEPHAVRRREGVEPEDEAGGGGEIQSTSKFVSYAASTAYIRRGAGRYGPADVRRLLQPRALLERGAHPMGQGHAGAEATRRCTERSSSRPAAPLRGALRRPDRRPSAAAAAAEPGSCRGSIIAAQFCQQLQADIRRLTEGARALAHARAGAAGEHSRPPWAGPELGLIALLLLLPPSSFLLLLSPPPLLFAVLHSPCPRFQH